MEHTETPPQVRDAELSRSVLVLSTLWVLVVVASGILLVAFRDLFTGLF